jgi:hypothetical protein
MNFFCKVDSHPYKNRESVKPEDISTKNMSDIDKLALAEVGFKTQAYTSYFQTTMEKDKSLLTLSVAGLGFLITLMDQVHSIFYLVILLAAAVSFFITINRIVSIFGKNAPFVISVAKGTIDSKLKRQLDSMDKQAVFFFYTGIILSVVLGLFDPVSNIFDLTINTN